MSVLTPFQDACLLSIARRAIELSTLAMNARNAGFEFDQEEAASLVMQILGCVAGGFDEELTPVQIQNVIRGCGLAPAIRGVPANDQHCGGDAA